MNTESQLYTRATILESQLEQKNIKIASLKKEIMRITNLLGDAVNQHNWEGGDVSPGLKYKLEPSIESKIGKV